MCFSSEFFNGLWTTFSWFFVQFSLHFETFFGNFWRCWKPWKMKPLPRENTIWEFLRAYMFVIFGTFFTVSSRVHILSIFYRILLVWELHLGTLGTTFEGLFFRSRKTPGSFLHCAPEGRPSATPRGEGGNWETPGKHLGDICETSGRHLGGSGRHLGGI